MMIRLVCAVLGLISFLIPASSYGAACAPDGADAAALRATWDAVDGGCPCGEARRTYLTCANAIVKNAVLSGALPASCRKVARKRAALSTCGRPGTRVCCRTMANATVKGRIVASPARCTPPSGGAACIASATNVIDGCSVAGCVACGNGLLEPGEECEPPGTPVCSASCMTVDACNGSPSGESAVALLGSDATTASVAAGAGGYLMAWTDESGVINGRRLDAAALPIEPLPLTLGDPDDGMLESGPLVAGDAGGWYVAWEARVYPNWSIAGLHVTADGDSEARHQLAGGTVESPCFGMKVGPTALAAEGDDQFAVTLTDYVTCPPQLNVYGHTGLRVAIAEGQATSTLLGSPDPIVISPGHPTSLSEYFAAMAHGGADTVMVLRQQSVFPPGVGDDAINAHWLPVPGGKTRLSSAGAVMHSVGAGGSDAQFLAAWGTHPAGAVGSQVRALRFTSADGPLDPDGGIVLASNVSPSATPAVVFDGTTWLVAWLDGPAQGPWHVFGVGLRPDGTVVDAIPRVLACDVARMAPSLTSRGSGWLASVLRPAGPDEWSLNAVPVTPPAP